MPPFFFFALKPFLLDDDKGSMVLEREGRRERRWMVGRVRRVPKMIKTNPFWLSLWEGEEALAVGELVQGFVKEVRLMRIMESAVPPHAR